MVRGLEEYSRSLTYLRVGWSCFGWLVSFAGALAVTGIEGITCIGVPISIGVGGVAQLWDFIAHVMYLQDLWRPWLRGLKLFLYVGIFLLMSSIGALVTFLCMGSLDQIKFDFCSWHSAAACTVWPIISSIQLILHSKMYRDEFRDLRTLLDF